MVATQTAVTFHGIGTPGRDLEPGEGRYWVSEDRFLRFLDLVAAEPDPARVVLTFDDANASDFEIALPALRERKLTGTFFVITGRLDRPGSLSTPKLRALAAEMEVGSHGIGHLDWRKQGPRQLEVELVGSKQHLEGCIGRAVTAASIPFGRYDQRVLSAARRAAYIKVFSTDGGPSQPDDFPISRTNVRAETTLRDFADLLRGRRTLKGRLTQQLKALRRRFI